MERTTAFEETDWWEGYTFFLLLMFILSNDMSYKLQKREGEDFFYLYIMDRTQEGGKEEKKKEHVMMLHLQMETENQCIFFGRCQVLNECSNPFPCPLYVEESPC